MQQWILVTMGLPTDPAMLRKSSPGCIGTLRAYS
jgi:hypothetical protein